jgi:hypothetical protein
MTYLGLVALTLLIAMLNNVTVLSTSTRIVEEGLKRLVTSMVTIVQTLELCWLNLNLFDAFFTDIVFINTKFHIIVLEKMKFNNQTIRSLLGPTIRGRGCLDLAFE